MGMRYAHDMCTDIVQIHVYIHVHIDVHSILCNMMIIYIYTHMCRGLIVCVFCDID